MIRATATSARPWVYLATAETSDLIAGVLIDWTAVERLANGRPTEATWEERYQAARILGLRGRTDREIATTTGCIERSVRRWRNADWPPVPSVYSHGTRKTA